MKKIISMILALIVTLSLTTFVSAQSNIQMTQRMIVSTSGWYGVLNPYLMLTETGWQLTKLVYDPLFLQTTDLTYEPWLVKDYSISEDMLTYTFELYDNITFHDGEQMTVDDVIFTYNYIMEYPTARFTLPSEPIVDMQKIDDYKMTMTLSSPQPEFINKPLSEMGILPEHIYKDITDPYTVETVVGSGPYKLVEAKQDTHYIFEANMDYFRGAPVAKEIFMPIMVDKTAIFTALQSKQIDATTVSLTPNIVEEFEDDPSIGMLEGPDFTSLLLIFNCDRYPFDRQDFRDALALAVDTQELVDVIYLGKAIPGSPGYVHPDLVSYNDELTDKEFDIAKANEQLDAIGFVDTNGDGIREDDQGNELSFELIAHSTIPERTRTAEMIRDWYSEIGIDIMVVGLEHAAILDFVWPDRAASTRGNFDMVVFAWGATTMGSNSRYVENFHSDLVKGDSNLGAMSNPELDAVLEELVASTDSARVQELLDEFLVVFSQDNSGVPLYYRSLIYAYNKDVFDGWKMTIGAGIVNTNSLVADADKIGLMATADTSLIEETDTAPENGGNIMLYIIIGIIAIAIILVVAVKMKRR